MIYLASPYSHPDPNVRQQRFEQVCLAASVLMRHGWLVFSPIAHSHPIALAGGLPTNFEFWQRWNRANLERCEKLLVLTLDGWEYSVGVAGEIAIARALQKPVGYLNVSLGPGQQYMLETVFDPPVDSEIGGEW